MFAMALRGLLVVALMAVFAPDPKSETKEWFKWMQIFDGEH
jgi:hypothetical protein